MTALSPSSAAAGQAYDAAQLYERYGEQIFRYCLGRLRDREEAADAVQNTFLRVHVALEKGIVPQFESAWLYKIAHNVCLTRVETNGRRARLETPRDLDDLDESALAAPQSEHEALEGLADALADLPHNLRQAILLREWQGLSYAEIAAAMDTTVPAVETLLYRARRQLAAALEQGGTRARRTLAGLFDLVGLRGLLTRCSGLFSGAGAAKVVAGATLLALGGSGVGAAVSLAGRSSPQPARRSPPTTARATSTPADSAPRRPAVTPARSGSHGGLDPTAPAATQTHRDAATGAGTVEPQQPSAPAAGSTTTASAAPVTAPSLTSPSLPAPTAPTLVAPTLTAPTVTAPVLPPAPTVPTPTSADSLPVTAPSTDTATSTTQLPVETPAVPATTTAALPSVPGVGG